MRRRTRKTPALLVAFALALLAWPAHPGGRDVPDKKKETSRAEPRIDFCGDLTVETVSIAGVRLEVGLTDEGSRVLRPALVGEFKRWLSRWRAGAPDGSCGRD